MSGKSTKPKKSSLETAKKFNNKEDCEQFIHKAWGHLVDKYGVPNPPLNYSKPHELAIAVILSAQCTDDRVNIVTKDLFREFPSIQDYYKKPIAKLEKLIYSTGFYRNKAKNIRAFALMLDKQYNGKLPNNISELIGFPGIGRKTANVVQQVLFGKSDGIVVDTHVARLSRRFGLSQSEKQNALKIENDLMKLLPKEYWHNWSLYMIFLGREFCNARNAKCKACFLNKICLSSNTK